MVWVTPIYFQNYGVQIIGSLKVRLIETVKLTEI
jgi:hypothetical protein